MLIDEGGFNLTYLLQSAGSVVGTKCWEVWGGWPQETGYRRKV